MAKSKSVGNRTETLSHASRIAVFKQDLVFLGPRESVRKYVTTGQPVIIDAQTYYGLRRDTAEHFKVNPTAIVLVGSCRLGFCLKYRKKFQEAEPDSDVDLAMVSTELFDVFWDAIFNRVRLHGWLGFNKPDEISDGLLQGWVDPRVLPNLPTLAFARDWAEFFDRLSNERRCGIRKISCFLFKNWDRLEAWQEVFFRERQAELQRATK